MSLAHSLADLRVKKMVFLLAQTKVTDLVKPKVNDLVKRKEMS